MRSNPKLLDRVLGQMEHDDPNTRGIAFETALRMLKAQGLTFREIYATHVAHAEQIAAKAEQAKQAAAATAQPARHAPKSSAPAAPRVLTKKNGTALNVHKPRVRMFIREVDGLRIIRDRKPPSGTIGVMRILEDRILGHGVYGPRHRMKLSFEADGILYEPFIEEGESVAWVSQMHRVSADGDQIIY